MTMPPAHAEMPDDGLGPDTAATGNESLLVFGDADQQILRLRHAGEITCDHPFDCPMTGLVTLLSQASSATWEHDALLQSIRDCLDTDPMTGVRHCHYCGAAATLPAWMRPETYYGREVARIEASASIPGNRLDAAARRLVELARAADPCFTAGEAERVLESVARVDSVGVWWGADSGEIDLPEWEGADDAAAALAALDLQTYLCDDECWLIPVLADYDASLGRHIRRFTPRYGALFQHLAPFIEGRIDWIFAPEPAGAGHGVDATHVVIHWFFSDGVLRQEIERVQNAAAGSA